MLLSASLSTFDCSQIRINSEDGIIALYREIFFKINFFFFPKKIPNQNESEAFL